MHLTYRTDKQQDSGDRPALEIEITPEMIEAVKVELRGFDPDYPGAIPETANDIIKAVLANLPPRRR